MRQPATAESASLGEGDVLAGRKLDALAIARLPNVLAEDTWDLSGILLR